MAYYGFWSFQLIAFYPHIKHSTTISMPRCEWTFLKLRTLNNILKWTYRNTFRIASIVRGQIKKEIINDRSSSNKVSLTLSYANETNYFNIFTIKAAGRHSTTVADETRNQMENDSARRAYVYSFICVVRSFSFLLSLSRFPSRFIVFLGKIGRASVNRLCCWIVTRIALRPKSNNNNKKRNAQPKRKF